MSVVNLCNDESVECPLCMEQLEVDDLNFYPCTCGYQICSFCWHRIRTDENGLCPACRRAYPENPADFRPLTTAEVQRLKSEKKMREQQKKQKTLKRHEYFGKFGKIHKVVINQSTSYAGSQAPSASAYVTYQRAEDALRAIAVVNNSMVNGRTLKASLGTTKYCSHFMRNQICPKPECMYLHELGDPDASFTKEDMQQGKHQECEKKLQEQLLTGDNIKDLTSAMNGLFMSSAPFSQTSNNNNIKESWPSLLQGGPDEIQMSRMSRINKCDSTGLVFGGNERILHKKRHTSAEEIRGHRRGRDKSLHNHYSHISNYNNTREVEDKFSRNLKSSSVHETNKLVNCPAPASSPSSSTSSLSASANAPLSHQLSSSLSSSNCSSSSSLAEEMSHNFRENNIEWINSENNHVRTSTPLNSSPVPAPSMTSPIRQNMTLQENNMHEWQSSFSPRNKILPENQTIELDANDSNTSSLLIEDDLGFDPIIEGQKALAELIQSEQQFYQHNNQGNRQQVQSSYQQKQQAPQQPQQPVSQLSYSAQPFRTQEIVSGHSNNPKELCEPATNCVLHDFSLSTHIQPQTAITHPPPPPGFNNSLLASLLSSGYTMLDATQHQSANKVLPLMSLQPPQHLVTGTSSLLGPQKAHLVTNGSVLGQAPMATCGNIFGQQQLLSTNTTYMGQQQHLVSGGSNFLQQQHLVSCANLLAQPQPQPQAQPQQHALAAENHLLSQLQNGIKECKEPFSFSLADWHTILPNLGTSTSVHNNGNLTQQRLQYARMTHKDWQNDWPSMDPAIVAAAPASLISASDNPACTTGFLPWLKSPESSYQHNTQTNHTIVPGWTNIITPTVAAPPPGFSHPMRTSRGPAATAERATIENL